MLGVQLAMWPLQASAKMVDGVQAGLVPDTAQDCTAAFQKAPDDLILQPGSTLRLAPGTYHFHEGNACQWIDYQSNTTVVSPRLYAILIEHANGLKIDGRGATLVMCGGMSSALGVDGCQLLLLKDSNVG